MTNHICYHCGRKIRLHSASAIYLGFLRAHPNGGSYEAWVCNKRCLKGYNGQ